MRELRKLLYRFGIYKTQEGLRPLAGGCGADPGRLRAPLLSLQKALPHRRRPMQKQPPHVERNMRYCVARAWEANPDLFSQLAQRPISQAPTTGDFYVCT